MDELKKSNSKMLQDKMFAHFKLHMRHEYSDIQDIGGLTVNNSLLNKVNMVKELKEHQELMSNNLKTEFSENLIYTFQALNLM